MVSRTPRLRVCHLWRSTESRTDLARTRSAGKTAIRQFVSVRCDLSRTRRKGESFGLAGQSLRESGKRLLVAKGGSDLRQYAQRAAFSRAGPKSFWLEPMKIDNFFAELKRRNVYKVAVAYAVAGWALAQGIAQVFPFFDIPNWAVRLMVLTIVIGFPIALVIAWAFELTPEGLKRTEAADAAPSRRSKHHAWLYIVVIAGAISIGLFFLGRYTARNSSSGSSSGLPAKSIAVMPLLNESADPKDEYFSDGLSEELIAALGQIRDLKVIGRSSSFRFKDRKDEPKTIGEKLGVSTLLEGTVRKQGDRVRIVAELVNAADGTELWSRVFDRELKDIFAVQEEIARAVAESLKVTLLGTQEASSQIATNNVEAHNAYLQGHFHLLRRNVEDFRKAISYYDQAIELDPRYALDYAERGEAWAFMGDLTGQRPTAYPKALSDAEKAVAIAPALAEARAALGWVLCLADWKFAEGLAELKRAKELSPTNPTANDLLARIIVYLGRFD